MNYSYYDLARMAAEKSGTSITCAKKIIKAISEIILDLEQNGEVGTQVRIPRLGKFVIKETKPRTIKLNGKETEVSKRKVARFKRFKRSKSKNDR